MISHELFHSVHQLSRQLTKHVNQVLQPFGLYSAQWSVLFVLKEKGPMTQTDLGDYLGVEKPPMTRTIQRLVKQEYVEQIPGTDKRVKMICLTEKAETDYPLWEKAILQMNERVVSGFSENNQEELKQLASMWLKVLAQQERKEEFN